MLYEVDRWQGGSQGANNWSRPCRDFDNWKGDGGAIVIRMKMGVYTDYLKPAGSGVNAQTMCTMLMSPGTWFMHSTISADGPFKARVGNHNALLGGWQYDTSKGAEPADAGDDRTWGVFW
jgi:hypothetical protein